MADPEVLKRPRGRPPKKKPLALNVVDEHIKLPPKEFSYEQLVESFENHIVDVFERRGGEMNTREIRTLRVALHRTADRLGYLWNQRLKHVGKN